VVHVRDDVGDPRDLSFDRTGAVFRVGADRLTDKRNFTLRILAEKHPDRPLKTNVEFYAAPVLMGVGLTPDLFPATFALARHAGWTAHAIEQGAANRLIRPDVRYVGAAERSLPGA